MAQFCTKCGAQIPDGYTFCPQCGSSIKYIEGASVGLKVLSVLIPLAGWIMYFIFKDENIVKAKDCAKFAWIGFGISFVLGFISGLAG